jgi:inward rectifier potassium channel
MRRSLQDDLYRHAVSWAWPTFFAAFALFFFGIVFIFACLFEAVGDCVVGARSGFFGDLLFFSVETFTTIGYGDMHPATGFAQAVVAVEAFVGFSSFALLSGLIFVRFSRARAHVLFAPKMACSHDGASRSLMVRLGNRRRDSIVDASARLWLDWLEEHDGAEVRRFHELVVLKADHPSLIDGWTLFHIINEQSPLEGRDEVELCRRQVRISRDGGHGFQRIVGSDFTASWAPFLRV